MNNLLSIEEVDRDAMEAILDRAESFAEVGRRDIKKVPTLRGRTVVTLFYESSTRTSSSFELAAKRLSADLDLGQGGGLLGRQGRVAEGHGCDPLRLRPGRDRHPPPLRGRRPAGRRLDQRRDRQRRRRQARAPEPGAARRLHAAAPARLAGGQADLDRRRRPPQPRRPLQPDRLPADGRRGDSLRPPDPDPARDRGARLRGHPLARPARRGRRRLRTADAAGADGRQVRPQPQRSTRRSSRSTPGGSRRASC